MGAQNAASLIFHAFFYTQLKYELRASLSFVVKKHIGVNTE